jgi:hypothetical protein
VSDCVALLLQRPDHVILRYLTSVYEYSYIPFLIPAFRQRSVLIASLHFPNLTFKMAPESVPAVIKSVAELPSDFIPNSFSAAVAVTPSSDGPNVFDAELKRDWCIGLGILHSFLISAIEHTYTRCTLRIELQIIQKGS